MRGVKISLFLLVLGILSSMPAPSQAEPYLPAKSVLALDLTNGSTISQKNPDAPRPIASITKLMTALVLLDQPWPANCAATVGPEDADRLKRSGSALPYGYADSCSSLFRMMLFHSENRAATALARTIFGSQSAAIAAMNKKAKSLGMSRTRFSDVTGLSPQNVSTARDVMLLLKAASAKALIADASLVKQDWIALPKAGEVKAISNTNRLVREDKVQALISKTGFTSEAGRSLALIALEQGRMIGIVILGSPTAKARETLALRLISPPTPSSARKHRRNDRI